MREPSAEEKLPARQLVRCKCHLATYSATSHRAATWAHTHRGCAIISLFTTQACKTPAGIKLLESMGWTVHGDPELANLPFGLVYSMSTRTLEEQATLSIVRAPTHHD